MARTKDRHLVSEAVRLGDVWTTEDVGEKYHVLHTDCDEQLEIYYGNVGQIRLAEYVHWNRDTMETVFSEKITKDKLKRVLQLLCASRDQHGHLTVRNRSGAEVRVGSIADGWDNYRKGKGR